MTQHECVQLDHVLQMYHVGYHKDHRPSSIRKPLVESATSITVQHEPSIQTPDIYGVFATSGTDCCTLLLF